MLEYLRLWLQSKIGLTSGFVLLGLIAVWASGLTLIFLILSAYIWLAGLVGALAAALLLLGIFLVLAVICATFSVITVAQTFNAPTKRWPTGVPWSRRWGGVRLTLWSGRSKDKSASIIDPTTTDDIVIPP